MEPALRLLSLMDAHGQISPAEAEEWMRRIEGWAKFKAVGTEATPSA